MNLPEENSNNKLMSLKQITFWNYIRFIDSFFIYLLPVLIFIPFFESINLIVRVILAAFLALSTWWYLFINKMSKGIVQLINTSNLLAAGFSLLFIFPGVYIVFFYDKFETARPQFIDYYPQSLALISLAGLSYIVGNRFMASKRKRYYTKKTVVNLKRVYLLIIIISVLSWMIRLWLLKTGTFYHTNRSDFQYNNYGILAIAFTVIEIEFLCLFTFLILSLKKKRLWIIPLVLIVFILFWYILGGQRADILKPIISFLICLLLYKAVNFKKLTILIFGVLFLLTIIISVMETYELLLHDIDIDVTSVNIIDGIKHLKTARETMDILTYSQLSPFEKTIQRLGDIRSMGVLYPQIPENIGYIYGASYWGILFSFIPHSIWPTKPDFEIRSEIMKRALPNQYASSPLTLVGEAYVNFSFAGVIIVFLLIGMAAYKFDGFVLTRAISNPWWGGFFAVIGYRIIWTSLILGQIISPILRMMVVAYLFSLFTTKTTNKSVQ